VLISSSIFYLYTKGMLNVTKYNSLDYVIDSGMIGLSLSKRTKLTKRQDIRNVVTTLSEPVAVKRNQNEQRELSKRKKIITLQFTLYEYIDADESFGIAVCINLWLLLHSMQLFLIINKKSIYIMCIMCIICSITTKLLCRIKYLFEKYSIIYTF